MITILSLSAGIDPTSIEADLIIKDSAEYPKGYLRIVRAIHAVEDLRVLVMNSQVARWLRILAQRYGNEKVTYQSLTVRSLLEQRVGLKIPSSITDRDILSSGLLDLNIPAAGQPDFQSYLLEIFFGSFMTKKGAIYRVSEIIVAYEPIQWQSALERPLVKKVYQEWFRLQRQSLEAAQQTGELQLLGWMEKSPDCYLQNLCALKLLSGYPPQLGERIYGSSYQHLLSLGLDLRRVPINTQDNQAVIDEIRVYLNELVMNADTLAFDAILEQASGYLEIELDATLSLLRSGIVEVTRPLVQRIRRKFAALQVQPAIAQMLAELDLLIAVPQPSAPQAGWDAAEWLHWATKEYLPYRFWLEDSNRLDDEIGNLAGQYADWLFNNYGRLRYNSEHMAWRAMLSLGERVKAHSGLTLVIMVDNFNMKFYPTLQQRLLSAGFFEQEFKPSISMLPSFTNVSKKSIIVGDYKPFPEGVNYARAVEDSWTRRLGKKVLYLPNIVALRQVTQRTHEVFFLNYLPIDYSLHQNDNHTGISHGQTVQMYLNVLVQDIQAFARRLGSEQDLMVIFVSDHGSTRIPRGTVNVIDHNLYRKHAIDEHHRFISISKEEASKLPDKVEFECYLFDGREYDLPESYLVAKRLYRFLPTDDSVYTHGGLTPEETIVPVAVFQPTRNTPRPLIVKMIGPKKLIAGTRTEVTFEITNLNNYPVNNVEFVITDPNVDAAAIVKELSSTVGSRSSESICALHE